MINKFLILAIARDLAGDDNHDGEYARALVELTAHLIGLSNMYADDPELVSALVLGTSR